MDPRAPIAALALTLAARASLAQEPPAPTAPETKVARITLDLPERPSPSALRIRSSALPDDVFELQTCETVLVGTRDLGLHEVKPTADEWRHEGETWSYTWTLAGEVELGFRAVPEVDSVALEYSLKNLAPKRLRRVQVHPCLPTTGAPGFFPGSAEQATGGRAARKGMKDFSELWTRLHLWSRGSPFALSSSESAAEEQHLAFVAAGAPATEWSWWKNARETFDVPLIALRSKDGKHVLALAFERSSWASSNRSDARACLHLFPWFGDLAPKESKTVKGRLYVRAGGLDETLQRFRRDFPGASGGSSSRPGR